MSLIIVALDKSSSMGRKSHFLFGKSKLTEMKEKFRELIQHLNEQQDTRLANMEVYTFDTSCLLTVKSTRICDYDYKLVKENIDSIVAYGDTNYFDCIRHCNIIAKQYYNNNNIRDVRLIFLTDGRDSKLSDEDLKNKFASIVDEWEQFSHTIDNSKRRSFFKVHQITIQFFSNKLNDEKDEVDGDDGDDGGDGGDGGDGDDGDDGGDGDDKGDRGRVRNFKYAHKLLKNIYNFQNENLSYVYDEIPNCDGLVPYFKSYFKKHPLNTDDAFESAIPRKFEFKKLRRCCFFTHSLVH